MIKNFYLCIIIFSCITFYACGKSKEESNSELNLKLRNFMGVLSWIDVTNTDDEKLIERLEPYFLKRKDINLHDYILLFLKKYSFNETPEIRGKRPNSFLYDISGIVMNANSTHAIVNFERSKIYNGKKTVMHIIKSIWLYKDEWKVDKI